MKKNQGITLIALVITIIVLLILAGISVATLIGENGVLTKANSAKIQKQTSDIKERAKTDIFGVQAENKSGNITEDQLISVLEKYFKDVPKELPEDLSNLELIAKDEYGGHKINISDIYNGILAKTKENLEKLAKDTLTINPDAEEESEKSPYVMYNGILCRVLYDTSSEYGLQIITADSIETVKLGSEDEAVTAEDFNYTGSETANDDFKKAAASYNSAVDTLNNKAKGYIDNKGIATNARCLGSSPDFEGDTATMFSGTYTYLKNHGINGLLKDVDTKFENDVRQVNVLGLNIESPPYRKTWLASRIVYSSSISTYFYVRALDSSGFASHNDLCYVFDKGVGNDPSYIGGFRPIFALSPDAMISDGEGNSERPYVIKI